LATHLLRATAVVGGFTLLSRVVGFVRDLVIAQTFGASASVDAFLVAFKIPNFLRRLFGEGAFSHAFVPVLSEYKARRTPEETRQLISATAGALSATLAGVTLAGILAAPLVVLLFAPGFYQQPEKYALTVTMLQITFPYLLLICLTAFAGSILNAHGYFAVPAFTPVLLNVCMIAGVWWLAPHLEHPIVALAWTVPVAGVVQLLFQAPFLARLRLLPRISGLRPSAWRAHEGVTRILRLMLPAIFGVSVTQINLLVDTLMASFLVTGSVSWLYYADRLLEFPIGVFGMALSTVLLPTLSRAMAHEDLAAYSGTLNWGLRWVFLIGAPCAAGLLVLAAPLMATLFFYGQFTARDVLMSSYALMAYTGGLLGFVLIKVLASGFYARQDTRTPVRIGVIAMIANITINLLLVWHLHHVGLALATACSALLNAALLFLALRRKSWFIPELGWWQFLARVAIATLGMATGLMLLQAPLAQWLQWSGGWRILMLTALIVLGVCVYFLLLAALGLRPRHLR